MLPYDTEVMNVRSNASTANMMLARFIEQQWEMLLLQQVAKSKTWYRTRQKRAERAKQRGAPN